MEILNLFFMEILKLKLFLNIFDFHLDLLSFKYGQKLIFFNFKFLFSLIFILFKLFNFFLISAIWLNQFLDFMQSGNIFIDKFQIFLFFLFNLCFLITDFQFQIVDLRL